MVKLYNIHHETQMLPRDVIYIGRPGDWGNPYVIGRDGSREDVVRKYCAYLLSNRKLLGRLHELSGKSLSCWCHPNLCHGHILMELANDAKIPNARRVAEVLSVAIVNASRLLQRSPKNHPKPTLVPPRPRGAIVGRRWVSREEQTKTT